MAVTTIIKNKDQTFKVIGMDAGEEGKDALSDLYQSMRTVTPGAVTDETLIKWFAENDPVAWRICYIVSQDILENWFYIGDLKDPPQKKRNQDDQFQKWAKTSELRFILTNWLYAERFGGYAIIVDWSKFKEFNPPYQLEVFNKFEFEIVWNETTGVPKQYKVTKKLGTAEKQITVDAKFVTHLSTRLDRYEGLSILEPVYYDLVTAYNLAYNVGQTFFRYGTGFPVYTSKSPKTAAEETAIENNFKKFHTIQGFYMVGDDEFEFKGVMGAALNPAPYVDVPKGRIATGSGIPKILLEGAEAGALASSETNQDSYTKFVKGLQNVYKEPIEDLLKKSGGLPDKDDWQVVFNPPEVSRADEIETEMAELRLERMKSGEFDPMFTFGGMGGEEKPEEGEMKEPKESKKEDE